MSTLPKKWYKTLPEFYWSYEISSTVGSLKIGVFGEYPKKMKFAIWKTNFSSKKRPPKLNRDAQDALVFL